MDNGISVTPGKGTVGTTADPQNTGQISASQQNPQTSVNGTSINNEGSSSTILLPSRGQLTTASIKPIVTPSHPVDTAAFIPIAVIIVVAIALSLYFYMTSKRKPEYY